MGNLIFKTQSLKPQIKIERRHYYDGLRAVACLLIMVHHTVTSAFVGIMHHIGLDIAGKFFSNFTQSGVEVFFLMSGILLLKPYFSGEKIFDSFKYYQRRFWRIYTPYFFAVLFGGFVMWLNTAYPTWYSAILIGFSIKGFIKQFYLFNYTGDYYNLAWWSLQIEVMFYIAVPFILIIFRRALFFPSVIITILLSLTLQFLALKYIDPYEYSVTRILLNPLRIIDYLPCFILGVFLAKQNFIISQAWISIFVGTVLQIASLWYEPFNHMGFAFIYFGILILIYHYKVLQNMLSGKLMVWIGERSYSLFLVHFSVLYLNNYLISYFVPDRSLLYGVLSRVLGWVFSFLAAMILFHLVERKQARGLATADQFWPPIFNKAA